jgi:hypothetical protein
VTPQAYTLRTPYADFRFDAQVLYEVLEGRHPRRPTSEECGGAPIPDSVWTCMQACWAAAAASRPSMQDVVQMLAASAQQMQNVPVPIA